MKRKIFLGFFALGITFAAIGGAARAEYRSSSGEKTESSSAAAFDQSVDLNRFRKGNIEWDTQELIRSGLTALHQEHVGILRELQEIKKEIAGLKAEIARAEAKQR